METLNEDEVKMLYGCLMLGEEFSLEDYHDMKGQFCDAYLYDKGAIKWSDLTQKALCLTSEAKEFLNELERNRA